MQVQQWRYNGQKLNYYQSGDNPMAHFAKIDHLLLLFWTEFEGFYPGGFTTAFNSSDAGQDLSSDPLAAKLHKLDENNVIAKNIRSDKIFHHWVDIRKSIIQEKSNKNSRFAAREFRAGTGTKRSRLLLLTRCRLSMLINICFDLYFGLFSSFFHCFLVKIASSLIFARDLPVINVFWSFHETYQ